MKNQSKDCASAVNPILLALAALTSFCFLLLGSTRRQTSTRYILSGAKRQIIYIVWVKGVALIVGSFNKEHSKPNLSIIYEKSCISINQLCPNFPQLFFKRFFNSLKYYELSSISLLFCLLLVVVENW